VVDRSGNWDIANPDGTVSYQFDASWNWDSKSNPERAGFWSDIWIIVNPSPFPQYTSNLSALWLAQWGNYSNGLSLGHQATQAYYNAILNAVHVFKGAHTYVVAIIWDTGSDLFAPGNLAISGNPDGTWGEWSKNLAGNQQIARTLLNFDGGVWYIRYWEPAKGG
jgi:hypothetical protein